MSYILDALRRADNERERSAVPGLHTRPLRDVPDDEPRRRGGAPWTLAAIAALAIALLAALGWILWPREAANDAAAAPPPAAAPATPLAAAAPPPMPVVPPPPAPPAPAAPPVAAAPTPAPRAAPPARHGEAPAPRPAAEKAAAAKAAAAPASAATPEPRPPALKDLPDELRRQIPPLSIGGSIYSESAASRFVIINGQLFHENDTLAPDLTLRQIRLKSAILEFRGQRFEIGY